MHNSTYSSFIKPSIDSILAIIFLIILFPIILLCIIILLVYNKGQVFFIQIRPGKNEIPFELIKFKTMSDQKDENGELLPDHLRLTSAGRIIRHLSLDEILQFINVIKGEMSIIGPRPLLMEYLPLYNDFQRKRHNVKPGITGWAQVNGRNGITWEEKFIMDVWYVENISISIDIKIMILTIIKVFRSEGISSKTSVTMEKYLGQNKEK